MCRKSSVLCSCVTTPPRANSQRCCTQCLHISPEDPAAPGFGVPRAGHRMGAHIWHPESYEEKEMQRKAAGGDWPCRQGFLLLFRVFSFYAMHHLLYSLPLCESRHRGHSPDRSCLRRTIHDQPYPPCVVLEWERKCAEDPWKVWGGAGGKSQLNESHTHYETPHRTSSISYRCCISTKWVCTIPPEKYSQSSAEKTIAVSVNN